MTEPSSPHHSPLPWRLLTLALLLTAACAMFAPHAVAAVSSGPFAMPEYNPNCATLDGVTERNYPGYTPLKDFSAAFFSTKGEYPDMCLTTLAPANWERMYDLAFLVTALDGIPLEELTEPQGTNPGPLEDCMPQHFMFDDFNNDGYTDILMLIGCYNGEADRPENENAAYVSSFREEQLWLQQREDLNKAVSAHTDPAQAASALRAALSGQTSAKPASPTPPPAPPGSPSAGDIPPPPPPGSPPPGSPPLSKEICTYTTPWGQMTMQFDYKTNKVTGNYDYRNGQIAGTLQGNTIQGQWRQSDSAGNFAFNHGKHGFNGKWNVHGDTAWRGDWNGKIIECRQQ